MSVELKKSMAWSSVLIALGVLALYSGIGVLAILVPAAILVYYGTAASIFHNRSTGRRPFHGGTNR